MKIEGLLPIGSVVLLEGGEHRLMVTGYCQHLANSDVMYDYVGCLWPEGHMKPDENFTFNADAINDVFFLGYQTDGQKVYLAKVEAAMKALRSRENKE